VACDFPLLRPEAIRQLLVEQTENPTNPVTAFLHPSDLQPEALLAIWTPQSLEFLQRRITGGGKTGPCSSLKSIWKEFHEGGCEEGRGLIRPTRERWLVNGTQR
jgi:molybdopterin-guanine dinucleotide biosynthesis protein A